ncbi:hypothetical protein DMENIID0001_055470 [Sergentomyia squamirostris]
MMKNCFLAVFAVVALANAIGNTPTPFIINGTQADEGQFPSLVVIYQVANETHGIPICSGSIIDDFWILSAAHCFLDKKPEIKFFVVAGSIDSYVNETIYDIIEVRNYPNYTKSQVDLALLKTDRKIVETDLVMKADYTWKRIEIVDNCTLAGWGKKSTTSDEISQYLRYINGSTIPTEECQKIWSLKPDVKITQSKICVQWYEGGHSAEGDSGGPLLYDGKIIGVLIGGYPLERIPSIFERVSSHVLWIRRTIKTA